MGIGYGSFAARKFSRQYDVDHIQRHLEGNEEEARTRTLAATLKQQKRSDGEPDLLSADFRCPDSCFTSLAMQCVSTINGSAGTERLSSKQPVGVIWACSPGSLAALTYQGGRLLGFFPEGQAFYAK